MRTAATPGSTPSATRAREGCAQMGTDWVVTAATERFHLDAANRAELMFTVTNPGPNADRVVLEIVAGERADRRWFGVQEPQRLLPSGTSATFLVRVQVPFGVPAG